MRADVSRCNLDNQSIFILKGLTICTCRGLYLIPHIVFLLFFMNTLNIVLFHCIIMISYGIWPYYQWSA